MSEKDFNKKRKDYTSDEDSQNTPNTENKKLKVDDHSINPISKDGMQEMDGSIKQCWLMILSHLDFDQLYTIASVCKAFFFLLKENDRFWNLFVHEKDREAQLPKECGTWKKFYLLFQRNRWNEERLSKYLKIDEKDSSIISTTNDFSGWKCAITKYPLMENYLYGFNTLRIKDDNTLLSIPIGICAEETELNANYSFGADKYRFGYYVFPNYVKQLIMNLSL